MKQPIDSTKPPAWFQAFEERNNSRLDKIECDIKNIENILERNNLH
jgi:hypothetical protein